MNKFLFALISTFMILTINVKAETLTCNENKILIDSTYYEVAGIDYNYTQKDFCSTITNQDTFTYEISDNKIYLYSNNINYTTTLLNQGYARVQKTSSVNDMKTFCQAEREAMNSMLGIWSNTTNKSICEDRYFTSYETKIVADENSEEAAKWGIKESTFTVISRMILAFIVGGFIIFIKIIKPLKKRRYK